ncbi:hypothetical protein [Streptomyces sp. NBC_01235]|uniref:hypothetical protein n=1 Tax=Streptomyces sp. NBC_01235 TaxID=2903788 RepID=UPI002E0E91BE|nr:CalY family protein [Streptomyces sp. NBC_01235]
MAAKAFRADLRKLIKLCGTSQKEIAENKLHMSQAQMSRQINSADAGWDFYEKIIESCLARISPKHLPEGMPQDWATIAHWESQFSAARRADPLHRGGAGTPPDSGPLRGGPASAPASAAPTPAVSTSAVPPSRRRGAIAAVAVLGVALVAGGTFLLLNDSAQTTATGSGSTDSAPQSATAQAADPHLTVSGTCVGPDTQWRVTSSGFTPNGPYSVKVTFPDGTPYSLGGQGDFGSRSTANSDGSLKTRWACYDPDPEGTYTMTVRDETTGKTATARFYVDKPN